jgi:hypothetical protein
VANLNGPRYRCSSSLAVRNYDVRNKRAVALEVTALAASSNLRVLGPMPLGILICLC